MRLSVLALVLLYGTFASTTLMHNPGQCIKLGLDCFNKALLRKTQCTKDVMDCVMDLECTDFYSRGDNCMHLYAGCTTGRLALEYFCEKKRNADVSISLFSVALIVSSIVLVWNS